LTCSCIGSFFSELNFTIVCCIFGKKSSYLNRSTRRGKKLLATTVQFRIFETVIKYIECFYVDGYFECFYALLFAHGYRANSWQQFAVKTVKIAFPRHATIYWTIDAVTGSISLNVYVRTLPFAISSVSA